MNLEPQRTAPAVRAAVYTRISSDPSGQRAGLTPWVRRGRPAGRCLSVDHRSLEVICVIPLTRGPAALGGIRHVRSLSGGAFARRYRLILSTNRAGGSLRLSSSWRLAMLPCLDCRRWAAPSLLHHSASAKGPISLPASPSVAVSRHEQHSARERACRKRPKHAHHASFAEPITARTYGARSCGMRVLPSAEGSSGSAEPVEELAGRMPETGAGAPSHCARCLPLAGAAFARERR